MLCSLKSMLVKLKQKSNESRARRMRRLPSAPAAFALAVAVCMPALPASTSLLEESHVRNISINIFFDNHLRANQPTKHMTLLIIVKCSDGWSVCVVFCEHHIISLRNASKLCAIRLYFAGVCTLCTHFVRNATTYIRKMCNQ